MVRFRGGSLSALADHLDERPQARRQLATARIVEVEAGEGRAPVLEHADEATAGERRRDQALERQSEADAVEGGADHQLRLAEGHRAVDIDLQRLAVLLERPAVENAAREAIADAGMPAQVGGRARLAVAPDVFGRTDDGEAL